MKKHLIISLSTLGLAGVLSAGLTMARAQSPSTVAERHPAIRHAIVALEEAKTYLQRADHDFGGHRKEALEDCDKALVQLKLALQYDKK